MSENSTIKILVADDEHVIADSLAMILTLAGFTVRAAYSGEQSVEVALGFQPDLLISDVVMTGMTGIEAAVKIGTKLPSCKVLLFSGHGATAALLAEASAQNHDFEILTKPVHPTDLLAKISGIETRSTPNS